MRRLLAVLALLVASAAIPVRAQQGNTITILFAGAPSGSCSYIEFAINASTNALYNCPAGSWVAVSGGSGSSVTINGGSALTTANFNATTPAAQTNFLNVTWQTSTTNVSAEVPVIGTDTSLATAGTIAASSPAACTDANSGITTTGCLGLHIGVSTITTAATPSGTTFMPFMSSIVAPNGTAGNAQVVAPRAGTVSNLQVRLSAAEGSSATLAFTLMDGATGEAVTCTVGNSATTCNDTTHTFAFAAGDLLEWKLVQTGTGTSQNIYISYLYQ